MHILPDGTIIPSYLSVGGGQVDSSGAWSNDLLRHGEVVEIIYPDDDRSLSKKFVEYRVEVQHFEPMKGNWVSRTYDHCVLSNPLSGLADRLSFTLRARKDSDTLDSKTGRGYGSKVLLLCLNGEQTQPIIIGGIRDQEDNAEEKAKAKDLKHNFYANFNGISVFVDKDGQLAVQYNGKTDNNGKRNKDVKESVTGTRFNFLSNGNWTVRTRDDAQYLALDHENSKVLLKADKALEISVSNGKTTIKSQGVELGDATDAMVLGTTYRKAEKQMNQTLQQAFIGLATKLGIIGAAATAAATAMKVPITGPVAAAPFMDTISQAALQAIQDCRNAAQALAQMEAQSENFLSKKNKLD